MYAMVILLEGLPVAVVTGVPATAKLATTLRQWLVANGIDKKAHKTYSASWVTCVADYGLVAKQAKEQTA